MKLDANMLAVIYVIESVLYGLSKDHIAAHLSAVGAVADECIDQSLSLSWHLDLHSSTIAGCGCSTVLLTVSTL